jgi:hypothetical protein
MGMLEKAIFPKSTDVVLALGHGFECLGFVNCKNLRVFYNLWGLEKDITTKQDSHPRHYKSPLRKRSRRSSRCAVRSAFMGSWKHSL